MSGGGCLDVFIAANIITCVCAFAGFIFGLVKFSGDKKALYAKMITFAVGCMAFGRLYQAVRLITGQDIFGNFQLGILGVIGSLVFLFSANYGLMDSLADDGSKQYLKFRLIPLLAPLAAVVLFAVFFLLGEASLYNIIIAGLITVSVSGASYFNLKHLIFPDVDFGVINCLKLYNLFALIYEFLCIADMVACNLENGVAVLVIGILMGITLIAITPAVERGMKKWTT